MAKTNSGINYTCPDIDKVIKRINRAIDSAIHGENASNPDSKDEYFTDICNELNGIESILEDLRSANDSLRVWGEEQFERAENAEIYINELENKIPI